MTTQSVVDCEKTLWAEYLETRGAVLRNQLAERFLHLIYGVVRGLQKTLPRHLDEDDLRSEGFFGLLDAIEGFEPEKGVKFSTYARQRIRGAILDGLRAEDWVPRLVRIQEKVLARACERFEERRGRKPTDAELARYLGISREKAAELYRAAAPGSVPGMVQIVVAKNKEETRWGENGERLEDVRDPFGQTPDELAIERERSGIRQVLDRTLSGDERLVILLYYYHGRNFLEIGDLLGLTESRICQIHNAALEKLMRAFRRAERKGEIHGESA